MINKRLMRGLLSIMLLILAVVAIGIAVWCFWLCLNGREVYLNVIFYTLIGIGLLIGALGTRDASWHSYRTN